MVLRRKLARFINLYSHPHLIAIGLLGIASGLPLALTLSTLTIWLAELGISKSTIGLFALIGTPYAIKFLWAPLIDAMPIPFLTKKLGKRRAWLLVSELCLVASILALGFSNPATHPWYTALFALLVAISSATQDIVIDAYRVERLAPEQQGAGAAMVVFGYRIGMLISSAGTLYIASFISWPLTYAIMAAIIPLGFLTSLQTGEPDHHIRPKTRKFTTWLKRAVIEPFSNFMQRSQWWLILCFIVLYKLGDAFAGIMTGPFLIDIGFAKTEIANIVKTYGLVATLAGAFIGGAMVEHRSMATSLLICGILQMLSNLMFVVQSHVGYDPLMLILTISVENIAGGMGTAAFVAFISRLCRREYTATQYALFSALAATGRTWLSASSGYMVDWLGWAEFFLFTTIIALPGILLIKWMGQALESKPQYQDNSPSN